MTRTQLLLSVFLLSGTTSTAQLNMSLLGQLDYQTLHNSDVSDVWGYVDEFGTEYALVGVNNGGVSVVSLDDPSDPQEVFYYPGVNSIWRDLKVYNDHAYITTEGGGGLVIIDLAPLPQSTALTAINWMGTNWESAHNLFIDENGIAYIFGADRGNGGTIFLDLTLNPMLPIEVGTFDTWYAHDGMARGDTLYASHISDGFFSIVDVSDKQNPVVLGTQNTGNNFTHNCWVSSDGDHLYTTDEVSGGYLGSYDISDPTDIEELDLVQSDPGSGTIPHNTHFIHHHIVTSYYRYGTTIHDVSRPGNVVEVGHYDHSAFSGNGFNGGWGTFPYLPSGRILSTDIENDLYVFDAVYAQACWLEGVVTDAVTMQPLNGATITLQGGLAMDLTGLDGTYATGLATSGIYDVLFSAAGYTSFLATGIVLQNGQLTVLDIALDPLPSFSFSGTVVDSVSGVGLANATVDLDGDVFDHTVQTDAMGDFVIPVMFEDNYAIAVGKWGHLGECLSSQFIDGNTPALFFDLAEGYADDMRLDLGWQVASQATSGIWERGEPIATSSNGGPSNPGRDLSGDCGGYAYVTGNGGGSAGNDDVDNGRTQLASPTMDLTNHLDPSIEFSTWFFNGGGTGTPNDTLALLFTNGTDTVSIQQITVNTPGMASWVPRSFRVLDHFPLGSAMSLVLRASDDAPGHLVEAGLDGFKVVEMSSVAIASSDSRPVFEIWPNPASEAVQVNWSGAPATLEILDMAGRVVRSNTVVLQGTNMIPLACAPGAYLLRIRGSGTLATRRLIVQ